MHELCGRVHWVMTNMGDRQKRWKAGTQKAAEASQQYRRAIALVTTGRQEAAVHWAHQRIVTPTLGLSMCLKMHCSPTIVRIAANTYMLRTHHIQSTI